MLKKIVTTFLVFSFLLFTFSFLITPQIFAADNSSSKQATGGEFSTSYDVLYNIDNSGITTVTEKINLTNLTSEYYASQFKLIIGATQVFDIKAQDGGGAMEVKSEQKGPTTEMNVKFNQQVAGLNKTLSWTLQFKSKDFAEKIGKVWEVRAPKVSSSTTLAGYNLTIAVPIEFGEPTAISPTPKSQTSSQGKLFLTFDAAQLKQSGVSASFGNQQVFDFDLLYHLENNNLVPIITNIALPPDTAYQDVIITRIEPKPLNVTLDDDGNYVAWYRLTRGQKIDVKVVGSGKLYTQSKVKNPSLEESLRKKYTQSDKYWEKDHPQIQSKVAEILGNTQDDREKMKLIYHYVVNLLKYDSDRLKSNLERLGALTALNNPNQAVCMEFTDLLIALARSAGIPTRELDGFAYTANPALRPLSLSRDILHAWPEYWDPKVGWVMVDPTWENTTGGVDYFNKLDLSHFVFAIKGSSSEYPIPAGSYKYAGQDSKDVKVNLSETDFLGQPHLDVQIEASNPILAGFPSKVKVKVANLGNAVYPSSNFTISGNKIVVTYEDNQKLGAIPPFGTANFDLNLRTKSLFEKYDDQIVVTIGSQKFAKNVQVKPFVIFQTLPLISISLGILMGLIYLGILGGRIYSARNLQKKK